MLVWNHAAPPPRCASRDAVVRLARLPEATAHWHAERVATPIRRRSFIHHCYHCRGGAEAVLRRRGRRCGVIKCGGRGAWKSPVVPSETLYNLRAPAVLPEPDGMPRQSRYARVTVL